PGGGQRSLPPPHHRPARRRADPHRVPVPGPGPLRHLRAAHVRQHPPPHRTPLLLLLPAQAAHRQDPTRPPAHRLPRRARTPRGHHELAVLRRLRPRQPPTRRRRDHRSHRPATRSRGQPRRPATTRAAAPLRRPQHQDPVPTRRTRRRRRNHPDRRHRRHNDAGPTRSAGGASVASLFSAPGGIRTHTEWILSPSTLPLVYRGAKLDLAYLLRYERRHFDTGVSAGQRRGRGTWPRRRLAPCAVGYSSRKTRRWSASTW